LFRDSIEGQGGNDAFVVDGFDCWNKSGRLKDHVGKSPNSFHNTSVKRCNDLLKHDQSVVVALDKQSKVTQEEYMIRLNNSISAVRYLLHQGLAFRGHDESKESKNRGNFRELADLLAEQNENTNDAKKRQARGLLNYASDFDFAFHLHLMLLILGYANALSISL
jgi:hypothetical protein